MEIHGEIRVICNANRAILVFFESEEKLLAFYNSPELSATKQEVQIITEKVSVKERELCVRRAATIGKVTLLTRTFGRGTDFICRNQQLLVNGGIHVLQTFFSEDLFEEYQIMGRGARQGDKGSYRMILLDKDLEWVLGSTWKEELPKIKGSTLYDALNKARSVLYESKCGAKDLGIENVRLII
jgi:preprotein translocase subunit SecA